MNFCEFLDKGRVYLDGGTGTELIKRGFVSATENLNVTDPDVLTEIHSSYVKAGSDVVYANTFNCNGKKADKTYPLSELIKGAAKAARKANPKYVLYDCGPIGELMEPNGRLTFEDAYAIFAEQAKIAEEVGFDGAVIETMTDLKELRCALLAFKENSRLPIICSMSFDEGGRTFLGTDVRCFGLCAQSLGAVAVGINCGTGPDVMAENLKLLKEVVSVPVFAKPNAGMPIFKDGKTFYDMDKDTFACHLKAIAESGIEVLGGCCGTDPSFIEAAVKATEAVDKCLGRLQEAVEKAGGVMLITADHGNCELMKDEKTGAPYTAHTTFEVPVVLFNDQNGHTLRNGGRLADLAPTLLELLHIDQPAEMTGKSLLVK